MLAWHSLAASRPPVVFLDDVYSDTGRCDTGSGAPQLELRLPQGHTFVLRCGRRPGGILGRRGLRAPFGIHEGTFWVSSWPAGPALQGLFPPAAPRRKMHIATRDRPSETGWTAPGTIGTVIRTCHQHLALFLPVVQWNVDQTLSGFEVYVWIRFVVWPRYAASAGMLSPECRARRSIRSKRLQLKQTAKALRNQSRRFSGAGPASSRQRCATFSVNHQIPGGVAAPLCDMR